MSACRQIAIGRLKWPILVLVLCLVGFAETFAASKNTRKSSNQVGLASSLDMCEYLFNSKLSPNGDQQAALRIKEYDIEKDHLQLNKVLRPFPKVLHLTTTSLIDARTGRNSRVWIHSFFPNYRQGIRWSFDSSSRSNSFEIQNNKFGRLASLAAGLMEFWPLLGIVNNQSLYFWMMSQHMSSEFVNQSMHPNLMSLAYEIPNDAWVWRRMIPSERIILKWTDVSSVHLGISLSQWDYLLRENGFYIDRPVIAVRANGQAAILNLEAARALRPSDAENSSLRRAGALINRYMKTLQRELNR